MSEIHNSKLGTDSSQEIGQAVFEALYACTKEHGLYLAAQCCEHLNRAVVLERAAAYYGLEDAVTVERVQAHAGIDIGDVLIGMQLKAVAVPVRVLQKTIGDAHVVCARTRPKYIGGERTHYAEDPEMRK